MQSPITLHVTTYGDPHSSQPPLLLLHGLFGSGDNWATIAKALSTERMVICPDLRNHGRSPHVDSLSYAEMAADVWRLCEQLFADKGLHAFTPVDVLGHSMGAKVAMQMAIEAPQRVQRCLFVDMPMCAMPDQHTALMNAMLALPLATMRSRHVVDQALMAAIPDRAVRQFLLTNVMHVEGQLRWRMHLAALKTQYAKLQAAIVGEISVPTLLCIGVHSSYVQPEEIVQMQKVIPQLSIVRMSTGHWPHAEQPQTFITHVNAFLQQHAL